MDVNLFKVACRVQIWKNTQRDYFGYGFIINDYV